MRHSIDVADLLGEYQFEDEVRCSYFGHLHKHGYLIEACCKEAVLSIGKDCGRKYVVGFAQLETELGIARELDAERALQETEPARLYASLGELAAQVERRLDGLEVLDELLPRVARAMRAARSLREQRLVRVDVKRFDPETGREQQEVEFREIEGLKLFGGLETRSRVQETVGEAAEFHRQATIPITRANLHEVRSTRLGLRGREIALESWLRDTARFWTRENLALALIKGFGRRAPHEVALDKNHARIIVLSPPRMVIGIEGVIVGESGEPESEISR